jgi:hypothetical protein
MLMGFHGRAGMQHGGRILVIIKQDHVKNKIELATDGILACSNLGFTDRVGNDASFSSPLYKTLQRFGAFALVLFTVPSALVIRHGISHHSSVQQARQQNGIAETHSMRLTVSKPA